GPELSYLAQSGRADFFSATDGEAMAGFDALTRLEGILPALESAHAIGFLLKAKKHLKKNSVVVVNLSGRGDKDMGTVAKVKGVKLD
ncbi:MAG: tryptophan synthase subunit beta, partial [bacterium]|nr:tryptophan synthase subunit beta [bacterium]